MEAVKLTYIFNSSTLDAVRHNGGITVARSFHTLRQPVRNTSVQTFPVFDN